MLELVLRILSLPSEIKSSRESSSIRKGAPYELQDYGSEVGVEVLGKGWGEDL